MKKGKYTDKEVRLTIGGRNISFKSIEYIVKSRVFIAPFLLQIPLHKN